MRQGEPSILIKVMTRKLQPGHHRLMRRHRAVMGLTAVAVGVLGGCTRAAHVSTGSAPTASPSAANSAGPTGVPPSAGPLPGTLAPGTPPPSPAAGTTPASPPPAATIITQADGNKTFTLKRGSTAELRLAHLSWTTPRVTGAAITLVPLAFLRDPGYQAWHITGLSPGQATIQSTGAPMCLPGAACPNYRQLVTITIVVT
ncbi:MAG: hypothetical protein NVSMB32_04360 [Actinomycetota bacterium]